MAYLTSSRVIYLPYFFIPWLIINCCMNMGNWCWYFLKMDSSSPSWPIISAWVLVAMFLTSYIPFDTKFMYSFMFCFLVTLLYWCLSYLYNNYSSWIRESMLGFSFWQSSLKTLESISHHREKDSKYWPAAWAHWFIFLNPSHHQFCQLVPRLYLNSDSFCII